MHRCMCSDMSQLSACVAEQLQAVRNAFCPDQMQCIGVGALHTCMKSKYPKVCLQ